MVKENASDSFLKKGRGRIVPLLRGRALTVNDLAAALELTDNAVRAHLSVLMRDGLVLMSGTRRGARKPHETYSLTPVAEQFFPKSHDLLLRTLLGVLAERMPPNAMAETLDEVALRLAAGFAAPPDGTDEAARLKRAVEIIDELGGAAEIARDRGRPFIRGYSCPLAGLASDCPAVCAVVEKFLSRSIGTRLTERCEKGQKPGCRFDLAD